MRKIFRNVCKSVHRFHHSRWFHDHISKTEYRVLLSLVGVLLFIAHYHSPDNEINVVLLIHALVTLDPTA